MEENILVLIKLIFLSPLAEQNQDLGQTQKKHWTCKTNGCQSKEGMILFIRFQSDPSIGQKEGAVVNFCCVLLHLLGEIMEILVYVYRGIIYNITFDRQQILL